MNRIRLTATSRLVFAAICLFAIGRSAAAQGTTDGTRITSPEVSAAREITFRLSAPNAKEVRLFASDIAQGQPPSLTKTNSGWWEIKVGPVEPGAYRYKFNVDGVPTVDPRNPSISEFNTTVWSLVYVPGSEFSDTKDVPHGSVATVTYPSKAFGGFRRMHIYTPPGYETSGSRYPVLYLLHGGTESDDTWSSVGRVGFILDNLIATKKAKPMIVVMPGIHVFRDGVIGRKTSEEFATAFIRDVVPYVESHYRALTDRANTAIAGLSRGGHHALNVGVPHLDKFGYIGVFSAGLNGAFADPARGGNPGVERDLLATDWGRLHSEKLSNSQLKQGLLLWFAIGTDDGALTVAKRTVELLRKHGFTPVFKETSGGHTWMNWRLYLSEFAPLLFRGGA